MINSFLGEGHIVEVLSFQWRVSSLHQAEKLSTQAFIAYSTAELLVGSLVI